MRKKNLDFNAPKLKIGLEPTIQAVPESNATNVKFYMNEQYTVISGYKP